jgi:hypothetical protein
LILYTLKLAAYSECFFISFKKGFLLKKALYKYINIFLTLAVNGISDDIVRRWKESKELLKHLTLVKNIFHLRINSFDISNKALHLGLSVLDGSVFRYAVVD